MRVGILTLPLHTNYGGILQAYALQTVLERMGHEVVVFDNPNRRRIPNLKVYVKRIYRKYIKGKNVNLFEEINYNKEYPILSSKVQPFIDAYINRVEIKTPRSINEEDYDAIIVGSDQVWRSIYFPSMWQCKMEEAFLDFAKEWNIKRISYAASFGTDEWEYTKSETNTCRKLISLFDAVSVREISAMELCKRYLEYDAVHVLDPTMLLNKQDYISNFKIDKTPKSKGTLLNYILDGNELKSEIINKISKERNLIPFRVNSRIDELSAPMSERVQPAVESWLRGFYDAEFIVTDSFHACVFAILFGKPFVAIGNSMRGLSRFNSLLGIFGLADHLISDISQYNASETYQIPTCANDILEDLRNRSLSFLSTSLN